MKLLGGKVHMIKKWVLNIFEAISFFIRFVIEQLCIGLTFLLGLIVLPFLYHWNNINILRPNSEVLIREALIREALRRERLRPSFHKGGQDSLESDDSSDSLESDDSSDSHKSDLP